MTTTSAQSGLLKKTSKRRAVVLIAVLVVVVILSLAGYHYCDMMTSEYKVSVNAHRVVQARAFADSGVYYAAMMLANPDNFSTGLAGNPWSNRAFQDHPIVGENGLIGKFSLLAPPDPEDGTLDPLYGVMDESGKINLNALMKLDTTGQTAFNVLMKLPNMTEAIAGAIVDWMDPDSDVRTDSAENDYYMGLNPPYRCKNGPLDSIDELLLVKDVTPDLLYGSDLNRNSLQDANEVGSDYWRGWAAYLTVHSREQNYGSDGNLYANLNTADINALTDLLNAQFGDFPDFVKFYLMYRQYGATTATPGTQSLSISMGTASLTMDKNGAFVLGGGMKITSTKAVAGALDSVNLDPKKALQSQPLTSIFELIDAKFGITTKDANNTIITVYQSPLTDPAVQRSLLPKLLSLWTLVEDQELPARINVNTAPREVLTAIPGITDTDVETILSTRPRLSTTDTPAEVFQTAAWLSLEAQLPSARLKQIEKFITGRTQVYRVQSIGSFEGKGPTIRVEAVIDTNGGRPRIIAWRDLSELGKGLDVRK